MVAHQEKPRNTEKKGKDCGDCFAKAEGRKKKLGPLVWEGASLGSGKGLAWVLEGREFSAYFSPDPPCQGHKRTWRTFINWFLGFLGWTQGGRGLGNPFLGQGMLL